MGKRSTARFANGIVSAILVVFFLAHGILGSAALVFGFFGPLAWLVWCGVVLAFVHVVVSIVTSREQLSDKERPPSARKKRHLLLKWITGGILALAAFAHVFVPKVAVASGAIIAVVSIALAVHLCVGSKSLLKDIGVDRRYKLVFRVVVCAFAALFVVAVIVSSVQGGM